MLEHDPGQDKGPPRLDYRRRGDIDQSERQQFWRKFWSGAGYGCLITLAVTVLVIGVVFASCLLRLR